ncbi:MAG: TadE/TadG family type IV pilus assembly protein [Steroidobacteraceae bacterium]
MVELAMIAPVFLIGLLVGIQFALIGASSLSLTQAAYQGARYAAVNPSADATAVKTAIDAVASPTISGYTMTMTPSIAPRSFGTNVQVTLTYAVTPILSNPFLGIPFPTSLVASESAMTD